MNIEVPDARMIVISDLHLGNPYSLAGKKLRPFLEYCRDGGWSLCINGDGLEILQADFQSLATHSLDILHQMQTVQRGGGEVFFTVGNHDITLEHLLHTWLGDHISPFLNVTSGDVRIRIEHGHLYDPFFVNYPRLYELCTRAAGPLLHVSPDIYKVWSSYQAAKERYRKWRHPDETGHGSTFYDAAEMLLQRGFDVVIFGHTHKPLVSPMDNGGTYVNSGNWLRDSTFVEIADGEVTLMHWDGHKALPHTKVPLLTG